MQKSGFTPHIFRSELLCTEFDFFALIMFLFLGQGDKSLIQGILGQGLLEEDGRILAHLLG